MPKTTLGAAAGAIAPTIEAVQPAPPAPPAPPAEPKPTTKRQPAAKKRAKKVGERWEDRHKRYYLWLPIGLPDQLRDELANRDDDRTVSALATQLLQDWMETR